jgi:hypothetical protein
MSRTIALVLLLLASQVRATKIESGLTVSKPTDFSTLAPDGNLEVVGDMTIEHGASLRCTKAVPTIKFRVTGSLHVENGVDISCSDVETKALDGGTIDITAEDMLILEPDSTVTTETSHMRGNGGRITMFGVEFVLCGSVQKRDECRGDGERGALVTASKRKGRGGKGSGGNIELSGAGLSIERGAAVRSDAVGRGGRISVETVAPGSLHVGGLISSEGKVPGNGGQGGPIAVQSECSLFVDQLATIRSKGQGPGSNRVHVAAGCNLTVVGEIQSVGAGDRVADNECHAPLRPDKPASSNGCVEVWSGGDIDIERLGRRAFTEINADVGTSKQSAGTSWIDIIAKENLDLAARGDAAVVHANQVLARGGTGGTVRLTALDGRLHVIGRKPAIEVNGSGAGGSVTLEAGGHLNGEGVDLDEPIIQALGQTSGGRIAVQAFRGKVLGKGGELNATAPNAVKQVRLRACKGIAYRGATPTGKVEVKGDCKGHATLPENMELPRCNVLCGPED